MLLFVTSLKHLEGFKMLNKVFDFQRSLMEKLAPVEQSLGYTPPQIPLDFTQRAHQDWFRLMSWYLVEEISEAVHATPEELPEELADCLHFAVELCILADVTPDDIQLILQMDLFDDIPAQFQLIDVVSILGMAVNKLKGKHWKKQFAPPDMHQFQTLLANMLFRLVTIMWSHNVDPYAEYFKKHELNEVRIQNNY